MYEMIKQESTTENGNKTIRFKYAIVRADGSLCFRVETKKYAEEILANLNKGG